MDRAACVVGVYAVARPVARQSAVVIAVLALVLAPLSFSFQLMSFLHAKELIYAVALAMLAVVGCAAPRWVAVLAAWLVAMAGLSLVMGHPLYPVAEKLLRALLALGFGVAVAGLLPVATLRGTLVVSGVLVVLAGLLQYAGVTDPWLPVFPHYDQRMYSVFGNQDLLAGYAALALALALGMWLRIPIARNWRHGVAVGVALVLGLALLLSESRSAWLAAACGCGLVLFAARRQRGHVGAVIAAALVVATATVSVWWPRVSETWSAGDTGGNLRLWFYAGTWDMATSHPWLGVGLGGYGAHSPRHMGAILHEPGGERFARNELFVDHAHADPLEALAEFGVLGLLLLGAALYAVWWKGPKEAVAMAWPERGALTTLAVFACLNPALASMPHAVLGLCCLLGRAEVAAAPVRWRRGLAGLAVAAGWAWFTFLPSAAMVRAEDTAVAAEACGNFARFRVVVERFHGPPGAYEAAIFWATPCLLMGGEMDKARLTALIAEARKVSDTGNLHSALADLYDALGDASAAERAREAVQWRWVER